VTLYPGAPPRDASVLSISLRSNVFKDSKHVDDFRIARDVLLPANCSVRRLSSYCRMA
jgi:hypothetical protein